MPPVTAILLPALRGAVVAVAVLAVLLSVLRLHAHVPGHDCETTGLQTAGLDLAAVSTPACPDAGLAPDGDAGTPADPHAPDDGGSCQCPPPLLAILECVPRPALAWDAENRGNRAPCRIPDSPSHPPEPPPVRAA